MGSFNITGKFNRFVRMADPYSGETRRPLLPLIGNTLELLLIALVVIASSRCVWHGSAIPRVTEDDGPDNSYQTYMRRQNRVQVAASNQTVSRQALQKRLEWPASEDAAATDLERTGDRCALLMKGGFVAQSGPDEPLPSAHGARYVTYAVEGAIRSEIERRDDTGFSEILHFVRARQVKLHTTEPCPAIRFGAADQSFLQILGPARPQDGVVVVPAGLLSAALFGPAGADLGRHPKSHALMSDSQLTGKRVRIRHQFGKGIVSIQPLDCSLSLGETKELLTLAASLPVWRSSQCRMESQIPETALSSLLAAIHLRPIHLDAQPTAVRQPSRRLREEPREFPEQSPPSVEQAASRPRETDVRVGQTVLVTCALIPGYCGRFVPSSIETRGVPGSEGQAHWGELRGSLSLPELQRDRLLHEFRAQLCSDFVMTYACQHTHPAEGL